MKKLDDQTAAIILARVEEAFPNLSQLPKPEKVRFLNGVEDLYHDEGLEAVTHDRILGLKRVFEELIWGDSVFGMTDSEDQ